MSLGATMSAPSRSERHGGFRQQLHGGVVFDLVFRVHAFSIPRHDAAVAVGRVLAQADVGDHGQGCQCAIRLECAQSGLHDSVFFPGTRGLLILLRRKAKEQQAADAQGSALRGLLERFVDR